MITQSTLTFLKRICALCLIGLIAGCSGSPPRPSDRDGTIQVGTSPTNRNSRSTQQVVREYGGIAKQEELYEEATKLLEASTLSNDPQTRAHSYEAMVQQPRLLARVVDRGLVDENFGVRSIAAMAIGKARVQGHEDLLKVLLTDESPFVSSAAVFALSQTGQPVDRSMLATFLFNEEDPGLRAHVAFLLGEMGDESALPLINDAVRMPMPKVMSARQRILELQLSEAMVKLGDDSQLAPIRAALFPALPSDLEATALAIQALGELKDRSSRGTLALLSESAGPNGELLPPEILLAIAISMAKLGDHNGWFLADMFWTSDRDVVRADSASVFGWTKRVEDLEKLERMLSDPSEMVRVAAAAALVRRLK
jgi:HEAT repeat protein